MRIIKLSQSFYGKYRNCTEMLHKPDRPYVFISVEIDGIKYAIPMRHHIKHKYAFFTYGEAGLDYTKAVVIEDSTDIGANNVVIDSGEWNLIKKSKHQIIREFKRYLKIYKKARNNPNVEGLQNIRQYSALQYFDV